MNVEEVKQKAGPILERHGIVYAGVFGSVARGEDGPQSDVDLILSLEEILEKKVDLVTDGSLNKHVRPYVTSDLTTIYERG